MRKATAKFFCNDEKFLCRLSSRFSPHQLGAVLRSGLFLYFFESFLALLQVLANLLRGLIDPDLPSSLSNDTPIYQSKLSNFVPHPPFWSPDHFVVRVRRTLCRTPDGRGAAGEATSASLGRNLRVGNRVRVEDLERPRTHASLLICRTRMRTCRLSLFVPRRQTDTE